jgi:hypothetical protein
MEMKKTVFVIMVSLILLIILHISYLTVPDASFPEASKTFVTQQDAAFSGKKALKEKPDPAENKLFGWLKATVSFTLKGSDGEDYGLTFRWYK